MDFRDQTLLLPQAFIGNHGQAPTTMSRAELLCGGNFILEEIAGAESELAEPTADFRREVSIFGAERQAAGNDVRSALADPLFRDPAHGDWTLFEDSPALKLSFRPFD